jgi:hypothetical protein
MGGTCALRCERTLHFSYRSQARGKACVVPEGRTPESAARSMSTARSAGPSPRRSGIRSSREGPRPTAIALKEPRVNHPNNPTTADMIPSRAFRRPGGIGSNSTCNLALIVAPTDRVSNRSLLPCLPQHPDEHRPKAWVLGRTPTGQTFSCSHVRRDSDAGRPPSQLLYPEHPNSCPTESNLSRVFGSPPSGNEGTEG